MHIRLSALVIVCGGLLRAQPVFNVKDYGALGVKSDNARAALQKAIDACGHAGGGTLYIGPADCTTGQLQRHFCFASLVVLN